MSKNTRRSFIQSTLAGSAGLAGLTACAGGGSTVDSSGGGGTGGGTGGGIGAFTNPILIVVNIDGGWDWLNVTPPTAGTNSTAYQTLRPTIKINNATDLGSGVGLNPEFIGMDVLHGLGKVAWIPGLSMPSANLSHFSAGDLWAQGGTSGSSPISLNGTGWLGRFADRSFSVTNPIQGVTTFSSTPRMVVGAQRNFIPLNGTTSFPLISGLRSGSLPTSQTYGADSSLLSAAYNLGFTTASNDAASLSAVDFTRQVQKGFYDTAVALTGVSTRTPSVPYPGDAAFVNTSGFQVNANFITQLKLIATLIASNLPIQVYYCRLSGWDTHSNELQTMKGLLGTLGGGLKAFYDDLASISTTSGNAQDRMVAMTWSEFGRRGKENSGGTDHGTNSLSLCVGKSIKGGLYGEYPALNNLDTNGNMRYASTSDYRQMYATILDRWLNQATTTTNGILGSNYTRFNFL